MKAKIIGELPFRSKPMVNMDEDMVRVTMDIPLNEWRRLKRTITTKDKGTINER